MKSIPDSLEALHPLVQALVIVCLGVFLIAVVFNREASVNFINIIPWLLYLMGRNRSTDRKDLTM